MCGLRAPNTFFGQQPAPQTARGCLFLSRQWTLSVWFVCAKHFLFSTTRASDTAREHWGHVPVEVNVPKYFSRVGQNRISAPYMTLCMMISLMKIPYVHWIYL